jgi:4-amino-4-deoxy-L-arabinose transferase-like glycosyltransferase
VPKKSSFSQLIVDCCIPLLFAFLTFWIMSAGQVFQFNPDEGIELSKVMLLQQGYRLYDQIWNDQPPLLTWTLFHWLALFGNSITAARSLILCFAVLLVTTFYRLLKPTLGPIWALVGIIGLCLSHDFLKLSVSVMRGLPALSLALFAVYLFLPALQQSALAPHDSSGNLGKTSSDLPKRKSGAQESRSFLVRGWRTGLSGFFFGISLHFKLFTLFLIPALFLQVGFSTLQFKNSRLTGWKSFFLILSLWNLSWIITFGVIGYFTQAFYLEQLLGSHFVEKNLALLNVEPSWLKVLLFLIQDIDYVLLAAIITWKFSQKQSNCPLFPILWVLTLIPILLHHQPLWSHYYLLLSIPMVWLGSHGLMAIWPICYNAIRNRFQHEKIRGQQQLLLSRKLILTCFALVLIGIPVKIAIMGLEQYYLLKETTHRQAVLTEVLAEKSQTRWLFTDLPITAFYTGIKIPPETVVFSIKRLSSGMLKSANTMQLLETYQPEQLVLGRFPELHQSLEPYLAEYYVKNLTRNHVTHYLRKSD